MKVWIIDDNEIDVMINEKLVSRAYPSAEIKCFDDPRKLLENAAAGDLPDLIISDLNMPIHSGYELVSLVHEHAPEVEFLLLSASVQDEEIERVKSLGEKVHIQEKPLNLDEINLHLINL